MNEDLMTCIIRISSFPVIYKTENLSPLNIIKQSGYFNLFPDVTPELISNYLSKNTEIIKMWVQFSEDIRHTPVWAFGPIEDGKWTVNYWNKGKLIEEFIYESKIDACAKMIKMTVEDIRKRNV
jgi:hypothetical protein